MVLTHWYEQPLGRRVLAVETAWLESQLPHAFGYYLVQMGQLSQTHWLELSPITRRFGLASHVDRACPLPLVLSDELQLPFACDSVDVMVLVHVLEYCRDPLRLLAEIYRCLMPEGCLLILGFNALSLWQLWPLSRTGFPKKPMLISPYRLRRYLSTLNYEVLSVDSLMQRPPIINEACFERLAFLEKLGSRYWPEKAGCYGLHAVKKVEAMIPYRPSWQSYCTESSKPLAGQ